MLIAIIITSVNASQKMRGDHNRVMSTGLNGRCQDGAVKGVYHIFNGLSALDGARFPHCHRAFATVSILRFPAKSAISCVYGRLPRA